jgi:hypothetical protein
MHSGFRPFCTILIGAIVACLAQPSTAQVANDNELYAAYCLETLRMAVQVDAELGAKIEAEFPDLNTPALREATRAQQQSLQHRIERFRSYLTARGLLTGARGVDAVAGITLAMKRAKSDADQCFAEAERCEKKGCPPYPSSLSMPYEAWKKSSEAFEKCREQCANDTPACVSLRRCHQPDNLPF